jgi:tripartite-type tricarboxylate transporter receptor subunit TctC
VHAPMAIHSSWPGGPNAINATVYEKLNFNFIRDIAPVARTAYAPLVVVVHPSIPAKTVPELIAYAKANPGKLNIGSPGNGTANHVAGEMFKTVAGINMVQVQYRGSAPAIADLLGGQVQVMFPVMSESIEYIKAGTIRALAVTSASRSDALPDLPTWPISFRDSRQTIGGASARRKIRPPRSSAGSTRKSTRHLPIP